MKKKPNTAAAMVRIHVALDMLQAAQGKLGEAASMLSSLRWGSNQQQKVMRLYEGVHRQWYLLRDFAATPQSLSVDSEPEVK